MEVDASLARGQTKANNVLKEAEVSWSEVQIFQNI